MGTPHYMAPEQIERPPQRRPPRRHLLARRRLLRDAHRRTARMGRFEPPSQKVADRRAPRRDRPARRWRRSPTAATSTRAISRRSGDDRRGPGADSTAPALAQAAPRPASFPPRFSRAAILGIVWAPLFPIAFVLGFTARAVSGPLPGTDVGAACPDVYPVAAGAIRAALHDGAGLGGGRADPPLGGRIYGLGLAVADGLLFPLLGIDILLIAALICLIKSSSSPPQLLALGRRESVALADYLIVRTTWRAASNQPRGPITPGQSTSLPPRRRFRPAWLLVLVVFLLIAAGRGPLPLRAAASREVQRRGRGEFPRDRPVERCDQPPALAGGPRAANLHSTR